MKTLRDSLVEQLKDIYSAETQLVEALPMMIEGAINPQLKKAIKSHLKETEEQVSRLDKISQFLDADLTGHTCKAMKGLIKEGEDVLSEDYGCDGLIDVQIVAAAQRVEHYEIAAYGNAIALAQFLDKAEVVKLLDESIEEEGAADKALTELCESTLFAACE